MVATCRLSGMSAQQAFDRVNGLLLKCFRDWYIALSCLPNWGEKVDEHVQKYIQGVQDVSRANLNWRFVLNAEFILLFGFFIPEISELM